jgi:hypothetical protein
MMELGADAPNTFMNRRERLFIASNVDAMFRGVEFGAGAPNVILSWLQPAQVKTIFGAECTR